MYIISFIFSTWQGIDIEFDKKEVNVMKLNFLASKGTASKTASLNDFKKESLPTYTNMYWLGEREREGESEGEREKERRAQAPKLIN